MGPHRLFWKVIWKLNTLPKVRVCALRLGMIFCLQMLRLCIHQNANKECQRCGAGNETLIHVLKNCPSAGAILPCSGLDGRLINNNFEYCIDWLEESMRLLDKKAMDDFITLLWSS